MQFHPEGILSIIAFLSGVFAIFSLLSGFKKEKGLKKNLPFILAYISVSLNLFALALK